MITNLTPKGIEVYREGECFKSGCITHRSHDVIIKALIAAGEIQLNENEIVDSVCPSEHGLYIRYGRINKT